MDNDRSSASSVLQRYLREESAWYRPAWLCFFCTLIFCSVQGIPGWTDPSLRLDISLGTCYWIAGISGGLTGWVVARYRWAGFFAGALGGYSSMLATAHVFHGFTDLPRRAVVLVQLVGLLPGVVLYWILHIVRDQLKRISPT